MLFITKNRIRKRVTTAVNPLMRAVEMTGAIPEDFWDDLRIIGFLFGHIHGLITVLSNEKYSGSDAMMIFTSVLDDLAGPGAGVQISKYLKYEMDTADFKETYEAGLMAVMISFYGVDKVRTDPMVLRAIKRADANKVVQSAIGKEPSERSGVSSALIGLYFFDRVNELRG